MLELLLDAIFDTLKAIPFLFLAYLLIEYLEEKKINFEKLQNTKKYGPLYGAGLGVIPQCGISVGATNLYATRVISLGTLISVYLATSDEALIILLSHPDRYKDILLLISLKLVIGMIAGFIIDRIISYKSDKENAEAHINDLCTDCGCEENILKASLKHTLKLTLFIFITAFVLNTLIFLIGEDNISKFILTNSFWQPFLTSLIGLIPNCAPSIMLTQLYIEDFISFGSILAGLLTGAGIGLAVLFRVNKNIIDNIRIVLIIYFIGVFFGVLFNLFS